MTPLTPKPWVFWASPLVQLLRLALHLRQTFTSLARCFTSLAHRILFCASWWAAVSTLRPGSQQATGREAQRGWVSQHKPELGLKPAQCAGLCARLSYPP